MQREDILNALKKSECFKRLALSEIERIADLCEVVDLQSGDYLFQQGDFGEQIYVIVSGNVFLERAVNLGHREGSVVIGALGKGRLCGCWSTLIGEPHILMSSAVCRKPSTVLAINGTDLRDIMTADTQLGFNVLERLCFILRDRIQSAYGAMETI